MKLRNSRILATTLGLTLGVTLLAGCSTAPAPAADKPGTQSTAAPTETEAPAPQPASDAKAAEWAAPISTKGDLVTTFAVGDISVDVYQIAVVKSNKTGFFADPSGKPIISPGDEIVYVNYVVTNNGAPVDVSASLVRVQPRYADWPYSTGMDSITEYAQAESLGLNSSALLKGKPLPDPMVFTLGKGESFNFADNFKYQKDSPINFKGTLVPVDSAAKAISDKRIEGEGSGVIK